MSDDDRKEVSRKQRERAAQARAAEQRRSITYIDDDGCEVTVTPSGHVFFNMADWY